MSYLDSIDSNDEHRQVSGLLAFYVNATLDEADQARVALHVRSCAACRDDLAFEQRVYRGVAGEASVEYMPHASLKRLQGRLDGIPAPAPAQQQRALAARPRLAGWSGAMAASVGALAIALSFMAANHWTNRAQHLLADDFKTVTIPRARPPEEVVRAVFLPDITLVELQKVLDEAQLRIVAGPTEAGVYSLASTSNTPVAVSLQRLRQHPTVRFAETTRLITQPDRSP